jgi:hypothetical protein
MWIVASRSALHTLAVGCGGLPPQTDELPPNGTMDTLELGNLPPNGTMHTLELGDLVVTYLSGRDRLANEPVFDMSAGAIRIENRGPSPRNLGYNVHQTFNAGHDVELGSGRRRWERPRSHGQPSDFIQYTLPPGQSIPLSRRDYMAVVHEVGGPEALEDGVMCTTFSSSITVDQTAHELRFGPHCFRVDMARDWDAEQQRYLQFFRERDAAALAEYEGRTAH